MSGNIVYIQKLIATNEKIHDFGMRMHIVFVKAGSAATALKNGLVEFWKAYWTNSEGEIKDDMYQWQEYHNTELPDDVETIKKDMSVNYLVTCDVEEVRKWK